MSGPDLDIVTGAFGYTGRYIARRLLALGRRVATLTGHPERANPFDRPVEVLPFNFDRPSQLAAGLAGVATLYNTYWVRFNRGRVSFDQAVAHTQTLIRAAEKAGVRRIVHISITNPSVSSPLPYFRGKALLEEFLAASKLSYAIIRPTVVFGREDILINNIAWFLRRLPLFVIPGTGRYRLQPVFVEDLAALAVDAGQSTGNVILDAVGPEVLTFEQLVRLIASQVGSRARFIHLPPPAARVVSRCLGQFVGDVVLTREEIEGLMAELLISGGPPSGPTRFSDWLGENAAQLGRRYASELDRHYR